MIVPDDFWYGGGCDIPKEVATCPECGGALYAWNQCWDTETGRPVGANVQVDCEHESFHDGDLPPKFEHKWHQSDWQPIMDRVNEWTECDVSSSS
jgi:hypothetical protein